MLTGIRVARGASVLAAALTVATAIGVTSAASANSGNQAAGAASASSPIPGGFCGYWGPNYAYRLPDGTVIRCG
jgi:hypothetical protein